MYEILLFTGLCAFLLYLFKLYISGDEASITGIPGPSLFQVFLHIVRNKPRSDFLKLLYTLQKKYGSTFQINIYPFSPIVVTSDHNYFGGILASKEYLDKPALYDIYKGIHGDNLVLTKHIDIWRNDRKILNEAFRHDSFKVFLENLDQKLQELEDIFLDKMSEPIDMQELFHKFILHTTIESLKDPSVEWDPERTNDYKNSTTIYMNTVLKSALALLLNLDALFKLTSNYKTLKREEKKIKQFAVDVIEAHLKGKDNQLDENNIIYRMHEAGVPYQRIIDNVILFIEASYETVATTLSYLFFEIAKNPDVQNKICSEIVSIIGNDPNASISPSDIQQMKYIHCVVQESLRIHTTLSYVMRKLNKPAVVNDVTLPKGANVLFFMDALHKSEKYYKDPLVFNPDRFNEDNKPNLVPNSWTPFSLGIRNCLGKSLAMQEVKLILAKLVRRFEFSPVVPEHVLDITTAIISHSSNGAPVLVKLRD